MGIIYKLKEIKKNNKNQITVNNKILKENFYNTLIFWGTYNLKASAVFSRFLLGKRYGFSILNVEHHTILLKRAAKFIFELKKSGQKILFVNEPINQNFDGIVKAFAFRALQNCFVGKWSNCFFIKKKSLKYSVLYFNPNKSLFSLKEANSIGIPVISLSNLDNEFIKSSYPIFCNNRQGDSIFFNSFILSNSIIEGQLFGFVKQKLNIL